MWVAWYYIYPSDLQAEHKVATDALLGDDVLHGAQGGAQVRVEELCGQQTHRGGHQVVWQGHICDLKAETETLPHSKYGSQAVLQ